MRMTFSASDSSAGAASPSTTRQATGCAASMDAVGGERLQGREAAAAGDHGVAAVRAIAPDNEVFEKPVVRDGGLQLGIGDGVGRRLAHVLRRDGQPVERDRVDRRLVDGSGVVHVVPPCKGLVDLMALSGPVRTADFEPGSASGRRSWGDGWFMAGRRHRCRVDRTGREFRRRDQSECRSASEARRPTATGCGRCAPPAVSTSCRGRDGVRRPCAGRRRARKYRRRKRQRDSPLRIHPVRRLAGFADDPEHVVNGQVEDRKASRTIPGRPGSCGRCASRGCVLRGRRSRRVAVPWR